MRVVIITQIFLPEMGALANRIYPLARHLREAGHQVTIATGMPNYPKGEIFPEYRGRRTMRETIDGITVERTRCYTTPRNVSKWSQLRGYLSFLPAALRSAWRAGPVDVVFVTSPPLFPLLTAMVLRRLRRAALILDLRDLWPDEIVAMGAADEGSAPVRAVRALERRGYRSADRITCTTRAFMDTVEDRGGDRRKLVFLPNGADLDLFRPLPADNPVAAEYPFGDRFVVTYSGLLGLKHGVGSIVEAADLLRDERDIVFFIRGEGPARPAIEAMIRDRALDNVILGGERPMQDIPHLLARSDACVTNLLPDPYLHKIISVKIFEYMACAKPVIAALEGEGARVVREADAGLVVPPCDARGIADAVLELHRDRERGRAMGERGREHVIANYSRAATAARLDETLRDIAASR